MDGDSPIRIGVIGYGPGGEAFHAPLVATTPGMELAAVVTGNPARRKAVESRYPGTAVVSSPDEFFDRAGDFDLAVVTTPNRFHARLAEQALRHGLHAVVDKPFAATAAEGRSLFDLAEQRGKVLSAFQNRRWDGDFLTVRHLLHTAALGDVLRFESRFERWRPEPKDGWKEEPDPAAMGGILYDLGSHLIDQAIALFGRPLEVYAELDLRRPGVAVDDDSFVALTHQDGTRSHLWMSATAAELGPRFRVLGSRAAYVKYGLDVQEQQLRDGRTPNDEGYGEEPETAWGRGGNVTDGFDPVPTKDGDYSAFYAGVAAAVRGAAAPPVAPSDTLAVLDVIDAARRSAPDHQLIQLEA